MKINKSFGLFLTIVLGLAAFAACQTSSANKNAGSATASSTQGTQVGGGATPSEAFKSLFAAVKSKDTEAIKANMSKTTQEFAQFNAEMKKEPLEQTYRNGFIAATMRETMPPMRDERVKENMGAIEVQDAQGVWQDVPFVLEDGRWKLAVGDIFKGTYTQPAPSMSQSQANTNVPQIVPAPGAAQMNAAVVNKNPLINKSAPSANRSSDANKKP